MKIIRPVEVVTCCICGEEFDKLTTREIFTGRVKYIRTACEAMGNKELAEFKGRRRNFKGKDEKTADDK